MKHHIAIIANGLHDTHCWINKLSKIIPGVIKRLDHTLESKNLVVTVVNGSDQTFYGGLECSLFYISMNNPYYEYWHEQFITHGANELMTERMLYSFILVQCSPKENKNIKTLNSVKPFDIENVIFNGPATIVFWKDGTKTVVRCGENDIYDAEKAIAMAVAKKALGNNGSYYDQIKTWLPKSQPVPEELWIKVAEYCDNDVIATEAVFHASAPISDEYVAVNKYGEHYATNLFYAGKNHKIACAGDCYHVKNIKAVNRLAYVSLEEALKDGCRPCKHCHGKHKEE